MTEKLNWGLYIGQKMKIPLRIRGCGEDTLLKIGEERLYGKRDHYRKEDCKPILRSLDQMTRDELNEFEHLVDEAVKCFWIEGKTVVYDTSTNWLRQVTDPVLIDWLTAKGFSIRGEIENGLAIREEM